MCGISGIASRRLRPDELRPVAERMARSLRHRGPDGTYVQCFAPPATTECLALGHNRLAIIDVSEAGREPMSNEDATLWLTFNGEIYNFREIRPRLEARGHRFRSRTDAEVIVHLYEEKGPDCVSELDGIFAFAILDLVRNEIFLARDRIGVKPLFYAATQDSFLFGSEIKAILATSLIEPRMNRQAVSDFFTFLYVPCPETAFEGISQLPPAHTLQLRLHDHSFSIKRYWEVARNEGVEHCSYEQLKSEIRKRLAAAVERQLVSDVPLGVFLSGGVDSTVVAGLAKEVKADIQTYTLTLPGDEYRFYNEAVKGRAVSRHLGTQHFELPLEAPELGSILDLVEFSDQPFANPTSYLMYELSRKARERITVALCGAGGDELFAGYPRSAAVRLARKLEAVPRPLVQFGGKALALLRDSYRNPRLRRARKFLRGLNSDFFVQYCQWTYFLNEDEKHKLFNGDLGRQVNGNGLKPSADILRSAFNQCCLFEPDNCVLEMDLKTFLADNVLEYTDRMSMATALEVRVPLLDCGFVEMGLNAPFAYKVRHGRTKAVLFDAFSEFFPSEARNAPKRGFNAPLGRWVGRLFDDYFDIHGRRSGPVREKLGEDVGASWREGILDIGFIQQLRTEHHQGKSDRSHELFACMIFDVWWRKYIRKTQPLVHW